MEVLLAVVGLVLAALLLRATKQRNTAARKAEELQVRVDQAIAETASLGAGWDAAYQHSVALVAAMADATARQRQLEHSLGQERARLAAIQGLGALENGIRCTSPVLVSVAQ